MFTGLIEKVAQVENFSITSDGATIAFTANFNDIKTGDSICTNGVCLSATSIKDNLIKADVMNQTLEVTALKYLKKGDFINLERALRADSRLDGHIVSGHVDEVGTVLNIKDDGFSKKIQFKCDNAHIIEKGSITVNGVSLTVSELSKDGFIVSLIPQTLENTNLKYLKCGDYVNIEYDIIITR